MDLENEVVKKSSDSFIWRDYKYVGAERQRAERGMMIAIILNTVSFSCFKAIQMMQEDVRGVLSPRPSPIYAPRLSSNIPSARKSSLPSLLDPS